jgi:hypothetical protein
MSNGLTFDELARLDPNLWTLEADAARAARAGWRDRRWYPTLAYANEFAARIWRAVGWYRTWQTGDAAAERVLRS